MILLTDKQIVKEFLEFLNSSDGNFRLKSSIVTHGSLYSAIVNTLQLALDNGFNAGYNECDNMQYYDRTILHSREDW